MASAHANRRPLWTLVDWRFVDNPCHTDEIVRKEKMYLFHAGRERIGGSIWTTNMSASDMLAIRVSPMNRRQGNTVHVMPTITHPQPGDMAGYLQYLGICLNGAFRQDHITLKYACFSCLRWPWYTVQFSGLYPVIVYILTGLLSMTLSIVVLRS